jgi:hypothetical protein
MKTSYMLITGIHAHPPPDLLSLPNIGITLFQSWERGFWKNELD